MRSNIRIELECGK